MPTAKELAAAKTVSESDKTKPTAPSPKLVTTSKPATTVSSSSNGLGTKIETRTINMKEEFKCRVKEIYQVFTNINVNLMILITLKELSLKICLFLKDG